VSLPLPNINSYYNTLEQVQQCVSTTARMAK
jgi:hypothetical protein